MMALRNQLDRAEDALAEERAHIRRQEDVIAKLEKDGHSTDAAERTVGIMRRCLATFERHRRILLERLGA